MSANDQRIYPVGHVTGAEPEFGIDANILKVKTFALDDVRDMQAYEIGGNVLWAVQSSSAGANMDIRMNDQLRDPLNVRVGLFIKGIRFSRLYISNTAQAGETITLFYCVEEFNNIVIENPSEAMATLALSKAGVMNTLADVALLANNRLEVLPANVNRRSAIIGNLTGNANTMRVGDAAVTATRGAEVLPGESFVVDTTEAIWVHNIGGIESVSVVWTED